jgi:cytochrome c biogenesis protein CcdA
LRRRINGLSLASCISANLAGLRTDVIGAERMIYHLIAGVLLGVGFCCCVLPVLAAVAGPDEDDEQ